MFFCLHLDSFSCFSFLFPPFETVPPSPTWVSPILRVQVGHFWRNERLAGQKSTSTEPGPYVIFLLISHFVFFYEKTAGLPRRVLVSLLLPSSGTRNHDAWVIERWDSLHCIWRWLAASSTKIYTGVLWRLTLNGISLIMIITRIRGGLEAALLAVFVLHHGTTACQ